MPAGAWPRAPKTFMVPPIPARRFPDPAAQKFPAMTDSQPTGARTRIAPAGLMFLAITSMGWGINWPINKYLLTELPPLTMRGVPGVIGAGLLALLAVALRQSLHVPRTTWPRLLVAAFFNVSAWMTLMGLALLWLPASEAVLIAYTLPIWASMLAWPLLGERPNLLRVISLAMAFAGLAAILGGNGFAASVEKLPGMLMALGGSIGFAIGTVLTKKYPLNLPPFTAAAWQIGIGSLPVAIIGLGFEHADVGGLSGVGWVLIFYCTVVQFCVGYVCWFAALTLGEPLGPGQIAALVFTLAGVVLATRS